MDPLPACSPKKELFCPYTTPKLWTSDWSTAPARGHLSTFLACPILSYSPSWKFSLSVFLVPESLLSCTFGGTLKLLCTAALMYHQKCNFHCQNLQELYSVPKGKTKSAWFEGNPRVFFQVPGRPAEILVRPPTHMQNYVELSLLTSRACCIFLPSDLL